MNIIFKNVMENLVFQKLDSMIDRLDCCKCQKCRYDIAAYSLNHLKPKYVATREGELYTKLDAIAAQAETDIVLVITKAAEIIKLNPRHNLH